MTAFIGRREFITLLGGAAAAWPLAAGAQQGEGPVFLGGVQVPDPLRLNSNAMVSGISEWESVRRGELISQFKAITFGQSLPLPIDQSYSVQTTDFVSPYVRRKIVTISITGPNGVLPITLRMFIPLNVSRPPLFFQIDHRSTSTSDPNQSTDYSPVAQINARGFAYAAFHVDEVAPDDYTDYPQGAGPWNTKMIDLFNFNVPPNNGGAISAWAWGASRVMDYLVTDPDIDTARVYLQGYSRSAITALWAGAQDTRFKLVISNMSGTPGARLIRHVNPLGQPIQSFRDDLTSWFPDTYYAYSGNDTNIPVDANELLSLIAPRSVYVASAELDEWHDPQGEFLGLIGAQRVYQLYATPSLGLTESSWRPTLDQEYHADPRRGYHIRSGDHGLLLADWQMFMDFAAQHFG